MKLNAASTNALLAASSIACSGCVGTTLSSAEVHGRVVDASRKKPIPGATVQLVERPGIKAYSGSNGAFRLPAGSKLHLGYIPGPCVRTYFPPGRPYSDELVVAHPSYQTRRFHARDVSAIHDSNLEPEQIKITDIQLHRK